MNSKVSSSFQLSSRCNCPFFLLLRVRPRLIAMYFNSPPPRKMDSINVGLRSSVMVVCRIIVRTLLALVDDQTKTKPGTFKKERRSWDSLLRPCSMANLGSICWFGFASNYIRKYIPWYRPYLIQTVPTWQPIYHKSNAVRMCSQYIYHIMHFTVNVLNPNKKRVHHSMGFLKCSKEGFFLSVIHSQARSTAILNIANLLAFNCTPSVPSCLSIRHGKRYHISNEKKSFSKFEPMAAVPPQESLVNLCQAST